RRFAFFFFTHTSPTERSPLSLHDALPISGQRTAGAIMRAVRRFVTLLLALICPASAFAQRLPAHVYDVSDGLPHVRVNALYEDRRGYLWIATPEGLGRFDGTQFRTYDTGTDCPTCSSTTSPRTGMA